MKGTDIQHWVTDINMYTACIITHKGLEKQQQENNN